MLVAYIDRVNFAMAAPIILKEFGMNTGQLGIIFSAFTLGYTIMNFPGGFLVERFSVRVMLTVIILCWSFFVGLTAFAWSFASLLVIRIAFGAFEGPMIPALTKTVNVWVTPKERGMASGMWLAALPLGIVIGNPLSGFIIEKWGWQSVFVIFGAGGLVVAYVTWRLIRNHPEEHPHITKDELNLIKSSIHQHEGVDRLAAKGSTVSALLRNPWLWVISIIYFTMCLTFWANLNWLPTYFVKVRGSSLLKSGFLTMIPWFAGAVGAFVVPWVSDHIGKLRGVWLAVSFFIMAPAIAFAVYTPSLDACLISFIIAIFFNMALIPLMYVIPMEIFPPTDVAKASGIMLGWGSFAGILSPTLVGYVVEYTGSFNSAYYLFAALSLLGGVLAFAVTAKERARIKERANMKNGVLNPATAEAD